MLTPLARVRPGAQRGKRGAGVFEDAILTAQWRPRPEGQTPSDWIAERKAESQVASTEPDDAIDIGASPGVIVSKGSILGNRLHFLCRPRRRGSRVHIPHGRDEVRRGCLQGAVGQRDDRSHRRPLTCDQAEPAHDPAERGRPPRSGTLPANAAGQRVNCPSCASPNEDGRKFCGECGARLAAVCTACGTANPPAARFCGECGTPLAGAPAAQPSAPQPARRPGPDIGIAGPGRRAAAGLGAVRGPGRLHDAVRGARSRGGPGAPVALLRAGVGGHRPLRRHRREVHRRRGHGGLGRADGPRGRRGAGGPGRPGARERRPDSWTWAFRHGPACSRARPR